MAWRAPAAWRRRGYGAETRRSRRFGDLKSRENGSKNEFFLIVTVYLRAKKHLAGLSIWHP